MDSSVAVDLRVPTWRIVALVVLPFVALAAVTAPSWWPRPLLRADASFSTASRYPYPIPAVGGPSKEMAAYQQRLKRDPNDASLHALLARLYLRQARTTNDPAWWTRAEQSARASLELQPFNNDDATVVVAQVAEARQDFSGALALLQGVKSEDACQVETDCDLALGRVTEAAEAAEHLTDTPGVARQALVREEQGDDAGVVQCIHQALSREEPHDAYGSAWSRVVFGRYFFRHGRYTLARDFYSEALRILPRFPLGLQQMAELETVLGHDESARKPDQDERPRDLACSLLTRHQGDDVAQAVALLDREVRTRRDWLTLDAYAWSLEMSHQEAKALAVEQEALACGIHSAQLVYRKSELEASLGQKTAAEQDRALALQYNPNFCAAHAAVPFMR